MVCRHPIASARRSAFNRNHLKRWLCGSPESHESMLSRARMSHDTMSSTSMHRASDAESLDCLYKISRRCPAIDDRALTGWTGFHTRPFLSLPSLSVKTFKYSTPEPTMQLTSLLLQAALAGGISAAPTKFIQSRDLATIQGAISSVQSALGDLDTAVKVRNLPVPPGHCNLGAPD